MYLDLQVLVDPQDQVGLQAQQVQQGLLDLVGLVAQADLLVQGLRGLQVAQV